MPSINNLVAPQGSPDPPDRQGTSGSAPLSNIVQQGGGAPQQGGAMQPPNHHETVALLQHINAFQQRFAEMLKDPEIGQKNMRPQIYDMMADMMSEEYVTLPQVMDQLKTLPTQPLEQKQWIEKHYQNNLQAIGAVLDHHAANPAPVGPNDKFGELPTERGDLVNGVVGRYKKFPKKPGKQAGIPVNA